MKKFYKSLLVASAGIRQFFLKNRNAGIQLTIAVITIILDLVVSISTIQWLIVLLCIALVLSLEMINTAIEKLCDLITVEVHPEIKFIKDVAAGAVLIASVFAMVTGLVIFIPALLRFLN